jgi:hypothetical protein
VKHGDCCGGEDFNGVEDGGGRMGGYGREIKEEEKRKCEECNGGGGRFG